jgi:hypothetical protein
MLSNVSLQQRRAASALSQQSCWPALRELLETELGVIHATLIDAAQPVLIHQLQGRAKATKAVLELVTTANEVLARMMTINDSRVASGY